MLLSSGIDIYIHVFHHSVVAACVLLVGFSPLKYFLSNFVAFKVNYAESKKRMIVAKVRMPTVVFSMKTNKILTVYNFIYFFQQFLNTIILLK